MQTCIFNKLLFIAVNVKGETKQTKKKKKESFMNLSCSVRKEKEKKKFMIQNALACF